MILSTERICSSAVPHKLFQFCANHKFLRGRVIFHLQQVRPATDLAVFHIRLPPTRRVVDAGGIPLSAPGALKAGIHAAYCSADGVCDMTSGLLMTFANPPRTPTTAYTVKPYLQFRGRPLDPAHRVYTSAAFWFVHSGRRTSVAGELRR